MMSTDLHGIHDDEATMTITPPAAPLRRVPVVGIIGGIGSGKSAIANWVAEHANVCLLDADAMGHAALESPSVKTSLCRRFGDAILGTDGAIARAALAREVFGPDAHYGKARRDLEAIVHPEINRRIVEGVAEAVNGQLDCVLLDAAVLLEAGWRTKCDLVVFIETPEALRLKRLNEHRGWSENELRRRESSQWSLTEKRREADLIVTNDKGIEFAGRQLLEQLQQRGFVHLPDLAETSTP